MPSPIERMAFYDNTFAYENNGEYLNSDFTDTER